MAIPEPAPDPAETESAPSAAVIVSRAIRAAAEDDRGFDPAEFRLSETGGCPRYRVAKAAGLAQPDRHDPDGVLKRGHILGEWVVAEMRRALGAGPGGPPEIVRREYPVRTPWGTGHADIVLVRRRHLVEVKSTQDRYLDDLPRAEHLAQVQAYLHFLPRIRTAELLYVVVGKGLVIRSWPVRRRPEIGQSIEAELRLLSAYRDGGVLPPIPEAYAGPSVPPCSFCPFRQPCWSGAHDREVPPPELPDLAGPAARLRQIEDLREQSRRDMERYDELRDRERDTLRAAMEAQGLDAIEAGGVRVRRTLVAGRRTLDAASAVAAGAVAEEVLAPFWKVGKGSERWTVR
jgi:hypothetical protein